MRDVWRNRAHLGRQPTAKVRSRHNILGRNPGGRLRAKRMDALTLEAVTRLLPEPEQGLAVTRRLAVIHCLGPPITTLAKLVPTRLQPTPASGQWQTVEGLGTLVAQTIGRETGQRRRVPTVGHDASSCRGVTSTTSSTGQRTGQGNVNNGTPSLAWASRAAAPCALRFTPTVQRFSQRTQAQTPLMVARKAVAHTLARACSDLMRDLSPFEGHTAFG